MTDSTTAAEKAELRELIREAHGAAKDLLQAVREARELAGRVAADAAREVADAVAGARAGAREPPPGGHLEHDEDCPLSAAAEAVTGPAGSDARWFREHPGAEEFCRQITPAEKAEVRAYGPVAQAWAAAHSGPLPDEVDIAYAKVLVTRLNGDDGEMAGRTRKFLR